MLILHNIVIVGFFNCVSSLSDDEVSDTEIKNPNQYEISEIPISNSPDLPANAWIKKNDMGID